MDLVKLRVEETDGGGKDGKHESPSGLPRFRHSSESIQIQNSLATELKIRIRVKRGSLTGGYLPGILDDGLPQFRRLYDGHAAPKAQDPAD